MVISLLPGCDKKGADDTSQAPSTAPDSAVALSGIKKEPADGIGEAGKDFLMLKTGNADDWQSVPVPKFNPLGAFSLYDEVQYIGTDLEPVTFYTLDGYTEKRENLTGERWVLSIANPDYSLNWLRWYTREAGGQWFPGTRDHSTFAIKENDTVTWWADANQIDGGVEITVVKVNTLPIGKPLTLRPAELSGNAYIFYTAPTNGKLQSAAITLKGADDSGVGLEVSSAARWSGFSYETQLSVWDTNLSRKKTDRFVLDDLPITEGALCWKMTWGENVSVPDEISVTLSTVADITPVKWGEAPGGIRVVGVPMDSASVLTPRWANVTHRAVPVVDKELNGVTDQNGDLFFSAPAGYYNLLIGSGVSDSPNILRLIPVNAGEITTVTIPPEAAAAAGALSRFYGDFDANEGGIELLSGKTEGDQAVISFVLNDPLERNIALQKEDISITEEGANATVLKVERELAGSDVVLVLDSSGSMGENMKPCVAAAQRFVESLPENSSICLVQFAQDITVHPGSDKASALKALSTVKEGGATALYDATAQALTLLNGKKRGYAVVFSDGADSREPGVDGEGSTTTKEEIIEQIATSGVTVLTIGFGQGHDPSTLIAMSASSKNGGYFAVSDKDALEGAFASIAGQFGNQYTVTYQRPTIPVDQSGTVPVISMMLDRSGSMDTDPAESENVGWRLDKVKEMFHNFILQMPDNALMQLGSFAEPEGGEFPRFDQLTSDRKANFLQALGSLEAGGGTPTKYALMLAHSNLAPIPSQKRVLVFFTDAALYDLENPEELDEVLLMLKQSGIRVLFAGLADDPNNAELDTIFKTAAEKAGGDYILTNSIEEIDKKLRELIDKINIPTPKKGVNITLNVDCKTGVNKGLSFCTTENFADFSPKTAPGKQLNPQVVTCKTGERYSIYNGEAAKLLYGGDQPVTQSNVLMRMPFENKQGNNKFGKLTVSEAYLMDIFKGIPAPEGQVYLALNASLEFSKADKSTNEIGYCIPNIFNHFYISVNEGRMMPPSQATWLAEKPLANPGESDITVLDKEARSGALVFLADQPVSGNITQLSLHLYDTANGHIELPLSGRLSQQMLTMDTLPTQEPTQMSSAFSLAFTGKSEQTTLEGVTLAQADAEYAPEDAKKNASFRILEAKFQSKVQALLDIDPTQRFLYQIETDKGVLMTPMSEIVRNLPLGFVGSTMLAPGSCSNVRLPFILPNELLNAKSSIYADLATGSRQWDVVKGQPYNTGSEDKKYSHEYFDLTVNALSPASENSSQIVLDFTLTDKKDGEGTGGLESILQLQRKDTNEDDDSTDELQQAVMGRSGLSGFAGGESETIAIVDLVHTNQLIFGGTQENGSWGAFDGQSRRGIFLFDLPPGSEPSEWMLTSSLLPELKLSVSSTPYQHVALLAQKPEILVDITFEKQLEEAVNGAIAAYQATRPASSDRKPIGLSDDEVLGKQVPSPSLTLYGSQQITAMQTDEDFLKLMRGLRWIPSDSDANASSEYRYAPEAVVTQGWGGQYDLAVLSKTLLARLGYQPEYRTVAMTTIGEENLRKLSGVEAVPPKLIGISYTDMSGAQKLFLPVFSADLSGLSGIGYLCTDETPVNITPAMGRIVIELYGKVIGNAGDLMAANNDLWGSLGAAMEGKEAESGYFESVPILDRQLSLPDMSLDAIDISYLAKPKSDGGVLLLPVLDSRQGLVYDPNTWVDSSYYEFQRLTVRLEDSGGTATHTTILSKEQKLNEIAHTLAWGVPELTDEAAKAIEDMAKAEADAANEPANYSVCRWLGHATISRLVKGLTEASREYASSLGLVAGRSNKAIALLVTTKSDGKTAETSVDLMDHRNQLHNGDDNACHAYNLMYGYFASDMEAAALPGDEGIGYLQVWNNLPDGTTINQIAVDDASVIETASEELGLENYPPLLLERMRGGDTGDPPKVLYLVPDKPATINGKSRWAWLEIDMESYDVVSVFETGERSAMTEFILGCLPGNGNYAEVGAGMLVGVTTAVGSVSAYTLTGMNYKDVMKAAQETCKAIGYAIGTVTSATGGVEAAGGIAEGRLKGLFGVNGKVWGNKVGFADAYNYGVELYFKNAAK
jgi:Mg-chelatase subunit ChlD